MDFNSFVQLFLSGLLLGGIYAMVAVGLALCFGVLGLLNLAHGGFLVLAAFTYQAIHGFWSTGSIASFLLVPLLFAALGWLTFWVLLQSTLKRSSEDFLIPALLITLGLASRLHTRRMDLYAMGPIHGRNGEPVCYHPLEANLSSGQ